MFRDMRRKKQQLSLEAAQAILEQGSFGVLALDGDAGYPYALPISYVYDDGKIYFHSATSGHKLDAIQRNPKASFCVVGQDKVIPGKLNTLYRSVIAFGKLQIVEDEAEKREALIKLAFKYGSEGSEDYRDAHIEKDWHRLCLLAMTVEHLSGKESMELVRMREKEA